MRSVLGQDEGMLKSIRAQTQVKETSMTIEGKVAVVSGGCVWNWPGDGRCAGGTWREGAHRRSG